MAKELKDKWVYIIKCEGKTKGIYKDLTMEYERFVNTCTEFSYGTYSIIYPYDCMYRMDLCYPNGDVLCKIWFILTEESNDTISMSISNDLTFADSKKSVKESKKFARKSLKESNISYDEFKKIVKKEFGKSEIQGFGKTKDGYGVYVIAYGEKEIEYMCDDLRKYGFECKWWHSSDPDDDEPTYFIEAIPFQES